MVPEADFTSYYGRPIVKAAPWERDIAYYLFTGGVAAGSSLLAGGADLTDRPGLRRAGRIGSLVALLLSVGRPGPRPRQAQPVPQHAARGQADLADVGRHLDPVPARTLRRPGLRGRAGGHAAHPLAARAGAPAAAARTSGRPGRGRDRPAGGGVHRGAARRHRHPGVALGLRGAPVRLLRLCRCGVGRVGDGHRARRRGRTGPRLRRGRRRRRAADGPPDGVVDGPVRRAAAHREGRHADAGQQGADRGRCRRCPPRRPQPCCSPSSRALR